MSVIKDIRSRKIFDSRGNPTIETEVILSNGVSGRQSVPSGASTGDHEVFKIEDIQKAIRNVEALKPSLINQEVKDQEKLDLLMINLDGTKQKKNLGGNVILSISLAICEAGALDSGMALYEYINHLSQIRLSKFNLPIPWFNIINGGKHADGHLPFQEFMVVPIVGDTFKEKMDAGVKIFHSLKNHLKKMNLSTNVGDEGGFAPSLNSNEEAMEVIVESIKQAGFYPGKDISMCLDVAASSIADLNSVTYPLLPIDYYEKIITEYPITIIEDPLDENDWQGWKEMTQRLGGKIKLVGDDIFTTNPELFKKGIEMNIANCILVKPDQIGTLSETLRTIRLAKENNYDVTISHRSGETESTFIADLAVGVGAQYIKTGAPSRGERVAKYNQLLRIEEKTINIQ
jgi:enolase